MRPRPPVRSAVPRPPLGRMLKPPEATCTGPHKHSVTTGQRCMEETANLLLMAALLCLMGCSVMILKSLLGHELPDYAKASHMTVNQDPHSPAMC